VDNRAQRASAKSGLVHEKQGPACVYTGLFRILAAPLFIKPSGTILA